VLLAAGLREPLHERDDLPHRPADAEPLEAAQLHHLQVGVLDVAVVVEQDRVDEEMWS
jgi:hypothetical protein